MALDIFKSTDFREAVERIHNWDVAFRDVGISDCGGDQWWSAFGGSSGDFFSLLSYLSDDEIEAFFRECQLEPGVSLRSLSGLLRQSVKDVRCLTERTLERTLGRITERFSSTYGELLVFSTGYLVPRIRFNSASVRPISLQEPCFVTHVYNQRRGTYTNDVNSKVLPYRAEQRDTLSEIAIPLFAPDSETPIAVLNLESNFYASFSPAHLLELEASTSQLVADLMLLRRCETIDPYDGFAITSFRTVGWHPDLHGWSPARLLEDLCREVSRSLASTLSTDVTDEDAHGNSFPSCTIWYTDRAKGRQWVLATYDYDYQFVCDATLPIENSLTGRTASSDGFGTVNRGGCEELMLAEKARRMGIQSACSTKIESIPYLNAETGGFGAVNVFLKKQMAAPTDTLLRNISFVAGTIINDVLTQRELVAIAKLNERLSCEPLSIHDPMLVFLNCVKEFLDADACSVFQRHGGVLTCVASTGLVDGGRVLSRVEDAQYFLDAPEDQGFTTYLGSGIGRVMRHNDVPDASELATARENGVVVAAEITPHPRYKYCEVVALDDPHSRFLGCSIGTQQVLGVVRVSRRSDRPPFAEYDERFVRRLAQTAEHLFSAAGPSEWPTRNGVASLRGGIPKHFVAPRLLVKHVLQTIVGVFGTSHGVLQASLRVVCDRRSDNNAVTRTLSMFSFYSSSDLGIEIEAEHKPVAESMGSNGWYAIQTRKIVRFDRKETHDAGIYAVINSAAKTRVESGLCVPIQCWSHSGELIDAVFCIDSVDKNVQWSDTNIETILSASDKISAVLGSPIPTLSGYSGGIQNGDIFEKFATYARSAAKADWVSLSLSGEKGSSPVYWAIGEGSKNANSGGSRVDVPSLARFGVESLQDGHGCRIPLFVGNTTCGSIGLGNGRATFASGIKDTIGSITNAWWNVVFKMGGGWKRTFITKRDPVRAGTELIYSDPAHSKWGDEILENAYSRR